MPEVSRRGTTCTEDLSLLRTPLQKIETKGSVNHAKKEPTLKRGDARLSHSVQNSVDLEDSKEEDISDIDLFEKVGSNFGEYLIQFFKHSDAPCFDDFFKWRGKFPVQMLHFESCTDDKGNFHVQFQVGLTEIRRQQAQKDGMSVIMSYFRAMKARQEYSRRLEEKRRNDAATVIASYFKGMQARRRFNKDRDEYRRQRAEAATTIATYWKAVKARQLYNRERASMEIASYWRAMKARQQFNRERDAYRNQRDEAATTIAAFWKAMKDRQQFCKDLSEERIRRNEAATTIESYFKAMLTRRIFNQERDAYRKTREDASTTIASYWKAMKARQHYHIERSRKEAATTIATFFKASVARRKVRRALVAEEQRRNDAVTTIASYFKSTIARRQVQRLIEAERQRKAEEMAKKHQAATDIKSYYKAMVARQKMQKYLGIMAQRRKKKEAENKRNEEEEKRMQAARREEERRLAKIVSIKVKLGKNKPELLVPLRVGDSLHYLRDYMVNTYGLEPEDLTRIKVGGNKVNWDTTLDELDVEKAGQEFKVNLRIPDANGRQKVFMALDKNNQRVLHKDIFYKKVESLGIQLTTKEFNRVWKLLDTDSKNNITYKMFQNIVAPEANMREFVSMIKILATIPEDERKAYKKSPPNVKRQYVFAQSQVVSDNARLHRLMKAQDIYSLFGALDAYMEGRLTLNLFQRLLDIAGLEVNQVHLHYLQMKLVQERNRSYLTVEDFLRLMNGEEYVTMRDVLDRINQILCGITEDEYMAHWKRIYQSKSHQKKMENTYKQSRRSPRVVLGLKPLLQESEI